MQDVYPSSFFGIWISSCSNAVCWKDYAFSTKLPLYLDQKSVVHKCVGLSGLSSLFCWSVCLPWCYYHTAGVVLQLCSFSKLFWCSRSCAFPYEFQNQFVNFYKMPAGILTDIILSVEINIESCDSWTWYTSPFM